MKQKKLKSHSKSLISNSKLATFFNRFFLPLAILIIASGFFLRIWQVDQPSRYIFDEDFHAFTAGQTIDHLNLMFEWWHPPYPQNINQYTYRPPAIEWLHPPVAKYIWRQSIILFGNHPFAWRLPSVIFGTLNVGLIIWLVFILTQHKGLSLLAGLILALEKLSLTQSQIAMNDIFLTSWLMLATIFYLLAQTKKASTMSHQQTQRSQAKGFKSYFSKISQTQNIKPLIIMLSAIFLGLATATKWTGFWVLPVFLVHYVVTQVQNTKLKRYKHQSMAAAHVKSTNSDFNGIKRVWHHQSTLISSFFYFLIIPVAIYLLAYSPLLTAPNGWNQFAQLHQEIIHYQRTTDFSHPHASQAWQWAYGQKPVYYALKANGDNINRVAQINPLLAIVLTGGFFFSLGLILIRITNQSLVKQKKLKILNSQLATFNSKLKTTNFSFFILIFLLIGALWLPWFFISRPKFIYYMTPVVPFLVANLMLTANFSRQFFLRKK